jgi:hypothetical protein
VLHMKEAFLCKAILRDRAFYFIWVSDPDAAEPDALLFDEAGNIPTFESESPARAFARAGQLAASDEPATIYDFDALTAWYKSPLSSTLDVKSALDAWNLFTDLKVESADATNLFNKVQRSDNALYDKLFWANNVPAVTPETERFDPEWDETELERLSWILSAGLAELISRVRIAT